MCTAFKPGEVGIFHRKEKGQLDAYTDSTERSMDIVMSANASLVFNAAATLLIFRMMYYHHNIDFWYDWKIWVLSILLCLPILAQISNSTQVFYES